MSCDVDRAVFDTLRADLARYAEDRGLGGRLSIVLLNLGFQAVMLYRLSWWLQLHHLAPLAAIVSYVNSVYTGAQISSRAAIGKGFVIYHPRGVVVGGTAVIGNNGTLVHGNLIGQLYGGGDRPTIGDNFYAASGAKVLGRIAIGDHVTIGANAVVIQSLPAGVTASGVPARIVYRRWPRSPEARTTGRDAILAGVVRALKSAVEVAAAADTIDDSTKLLGEGLGMDSIEVLRLVCALEEELGVTIDDSELALGHFRTVGALADFIERRGDR